MIDWSIFSFHSTPFTTNQSFNVFSVGNDVKSRAKQKQLVSMAATSLLWTPTSLTLTLNGGRESHKLNANSISFQQQRRFRSKTRICCCNDDTKRQTPQSEAIQVYSQVERSFLFPLFYYYYYYSVCSFANCFAIFVLLKITQPSYGLIFLKERWRVISCCGLI